MKVRRIVCLVLCLILCISTVFTVSYAASKNRVYAAEITAKPGDEIEIPIQISNNSGFMGIALVFSYDSSAMTPISAKRGSIVTSGLFDDSIETSQSNEFKVIWCGSDNIQRDGNLCTLKFKINDSASGEYKLTISFEQNNTYDNNYKPVKLNCEDVSISVQSTTPQKESFWKKLINPFIKVWKWITGLFTK